MCPKISYFHPVGLKKKFGGNGMTTHTSMTTIHVDTGVRKKLQALKKKGETLQ